MYLCSYCEKPSMTFERYWHTSSWNAWICTTCTKCLWQEFQYKMDAKCDDFHELCSLFPESVCEKVYVVKQDRKREREEDPIAYDLKRLRLE